ncbi:MAG: DUF2971 domain-containing protein [Oliverpabstia sp.]
MILGGKKIRFNNLLNVDDPDEIETADLSNWGRHCFVSCWTKSADDVLSMWNMYTPDIHGVRIGMRELPFKLYLYEKGTYEFTANTITCINMGKLYKERKAVIVPDNPQLIDVEYTDDEDKLNPHIKIATNINGTINVSVTFKPIGKYKKTCWSYQQESRYKIMALPYPVKELHKLKNPEEYQKIIDVISDESIEQAYDEFFLELADDAFQNMEILLGPKTSKTEEIIVQALVDKYCPDDNVVIRKSGINLI